MRLLAGSVVAALALTLAACSGSGGPPRLNKRALAVIDKALASAPGQAQPSRVVAAELAFARAAREQGQWTAFAQFAAPGALLHGTNGPFPIAPWLATQTNPPEAVAWQPRAVAMSCDGALAVSQGRLRNPDGTVGNFFTVWERQADGRYLYVFDAGGVDVPQPPPRQRIAEGDIVVTALDAVQGLVASCPRAGEAIPPPPPPPLPIAASGMSDARLSRDGTLRWRWEHRADGTRYGAADYYYEGRWLTAFEQSLIVPPASAPAP